MGEWITWRMIGKFLLGAAILALYIYGQEFWVWRDVSESLVKRSRKTTWIEGTVLALLVLFILFWLPGIIRSLHK